MVCLAEKNVAPAKNVTRVTFDVDYARQMILVLHVHCLANCLRMKVSVSLHQKGWQLSLGRLITVLPAKSDSGVMFCLQSYHGLIIDRLLVY